MLQLGDASLHASSTLATNMVLFSIAAEVEESVRDHVCVTSTSTWPSPTSSAAKLAMMSPAVTFSVVGS